MSRGGGISYLLVHAERCTGCRVCEGVCSMTQERVLNRAKSRIRIYRTEVLELTQKVCAQCAERPCLAACPTGAIFEKDGQVRIRRAACDSCGNCAAVCDRIFLAPDDGHAMMCNQCGACARACPEQALEIGERPC